MQTRICDCWLNIGQCKCEINKIKNEREQINSNGESNKEHNGDAKRNPESDAKPKRPLDWDARDLEVDGRVLGSSRSTKGEYTHRFWE
jgi:hypothetical protein